MQCHFLPAKVCDSVDKMMRDFIGGSTEERRRMHLVRWNTVTMPKDLGGLGLFSMKLFLPNIVGDLPMRKANLGLICY